MLKGDVRDNVELKTVGEDLWKYSDEINSKDVVAREEEQENSDMTLRDTINKLSTHEI